MNDEYWNGEINLLAIKYGTVSYSDLINMRQFCRDRVSPSRVDSIEWVTFLDALKVTNQISSPSVGSSTSTWYDYALSGNFSIGPNSNKTDFTIEKGFVTVSDGGMISLYPITNTADEDYHFFLVIRENSPMVGYASIVSMEDSGVFLWSIGLNDGVLNVASAFGATSTGIVCTGTTTFLYISHHVEGITRFISVYVNGTIAFSTSSGIPFLGSTALVRIGRDPTQTLSQPLFASLSIVAVSIGPLSDSEINATSRYCTDRLNYLVSL
jgi:hypothetical protein